MVGVDMADRFVVVPRPLLLSSGDFYLIERQAVKHAPIWTDRARMAEIVDRKLAHFGGDSIGIQRVGAFHGL